MVIMRHRGWRPVTGMWAAAILGAALVSAAALAPPAAQARDTAGGPALTWSAATFVEQPPFQHGYDIEAVSCATATQCVAVDSQGAVLLAAHPAGGWPAWRMVSGSIPYHFTTDQPVSCVRGAPIFCIIADGGGILTSTDPGGGGSAWLETPVKAAAVTCLSPSLCVGGGTGTILTSTNPAGGAGAWTTVHVDAGKIAAISCPTSSFCAAVDQQGNVLTSINPTGGATDWRVTAIAAGQPLTDISCPSASLCVASDAAGNVLTSTKPTGGSSAWSEKKKIK